MKALELVVAAAAASAVSFAVVAASPAAAAAAAVDERRHEPIRLSRRATQDPKSCFSSWQDGAGTFNVMCSKGSDLSAVKSELTSAGFNCWTDSKYFGQFWCSKNVPSWLPTGDPLSCFSTWTDGGSFNVGCSNPADVAPFQATLKGKGLNCWGTSPLFYCNTPQPPYIPSIDPKGCFSDWNSTDTYNVRCTNVNDLASIKTFLVGTGQNCWNSTSSADVQFWCNLSAPNWLPQGNPLSCFSDWHDSGSYSLRCTSSGDLQTLRNTLGARYATNCWNDNLVPGVAYCSQPQPLWLPSGDSRSCVSDWHDTVTYNVVCEVAGDLALVRDAINTNAGHCWTGSDASQFWCYLPRPNWLPDTASGGNYVVTLSTSDNRGVWDGFGTSVAWWGRGVGGSASETLIADLVFSTADSVTLPNGASIPALGLQIARYNIGGSGVAGDKTTSGKTEASSAMPWYKRVEGFWIDGGNADPSSSSWNWDRDANQRSILRAAYARGATFEFFSNAPMWWMTNELTSAGGALASSQYSNFAKYVAATVSHSQRYWGIPVRSVEMFNEPTAGWWNIGTGQEGCNIKTDVQYTLLGNLQTELAALSITNVTIAASDENSVSAAITTLATSVGSRTGRLNVHGYSGLDPFRDNSARTKLRSAAGSRPLWMSEFGNGDNDGMVTVQSITEDINFLKPSAWVYWQIVEPVGGWGPLNAQYGSDSDQNSPDRAKLVAVNTKYYMIAQFSRFIRAGYTIYGSSDANTVAAYSGSGSSKLVFVTVNYGNGQTITYDLTTGGIKGSAGTVTVYATNSGGKKLLKKSTATFNGKYALKAEANSVYTLVFDGVSI
ncbi:glycoside hydrolase superfamily [Zopfochytrium polystomum]|nr:glycoside hydrolase superfamily [Zopfochytrium polystomum]